MSRSQVSRREDPEAFAPLDARLLAGMKALRDGPGRTPRVRSGPSPSWRWSSGRDLPTASGRDVAWAFGAGMGGMAVGALVVLALVLSTVGVGAAALALLGASAGAGLGLWVGLVRRHGWGRRQLGFVPSRRSSWQLLWQVPVSLLLSVTATAVIGPLLGLAPEGADAASELVDESLTSTPLLVAVAVACLVLLLPAAEEVVFRRVLLGWLVTRVPVPVAVVVASLVFAAVHVAPVAVLYLSFFAVAANVLYLWHRSLWAPLALHAANNAMATAVVLAAIGA